jgi:hypothetical protein
MKNLLPIVFVLIVASLGAQSSILLNVQGILRTASGIAVPDGPQNITFKLYDVPSGGMAMWEETAQINVTAGIYNYNLGSGTSINPGIFANSLFLGVTVDGTELLPRAQLTFSPYAIRAFTVACSGAVGDVKYSILNPEEFRMENGDCWVPMDGRALAPTDRLRMTTGITNVPNAGGLFIRSQDNSNSDNDPARDHTSPIATIQTDNFKTHTHEMASAGQHSHTYNDYLVSILFGYEIDLFSSFRPLVAIINPESNVYELFPYTTEEAGEHVHTINSTGGAETRPKNLNLWTYIRIN